jgi:hypothetical protein
LKFSLLANSPVLAFPDLPLTAQKAYLQRYVVECCCVDGFDYADLDKYFDNGENGWLAFIAEATPLLAGRFFRYGLCEADDIKHRIMKVEPEISQDFNTFQEYADWYCSGPMPEYSEKDRWPCVASGDELVLEDGWHRLHAYIKAGHATIPVLEFA